ncbi:hypothetical protein OS493_024204 [Desmophyllum pertusum]|uniref:Uncharacterized protein n=1 Tax=Desmophyllum pertusum TaxID=174260 RepID=A0A9X0CWM2_9CNID|nr:hypothetical protein OS493_024204 [Desmophyllum pertusum]
MSSGSRFAAACCLKYVQQCIGNALRSRPHSTLWVRNTPPTGRIGYHFDTPQRDEFEPMIENIVLTESNENVEGTKPSFRKAILSYSKLPLKLKSQNSLPYIRQFPG